MGPLNPKHPAITDSVSFKAYLKRDGQEVEVRRFGVDPGAATSYVYLRSKIQAMFPAIQNDQFQIFWQDVDQDYIRMDSDEELLEALTSSNQRPLKVYIHVQNSQGAPGTAGQQTHPGVTCDACEGPVVGFRYKCVTCPDYDLCSRCEAGGLHEQHFMLRMPAPMDSVLRHPKFIRKLFSHPHKFHKRHGWGRQRGCGDSQAGPNPPPPAKCPAMAGVTDMFDFSALMELLESVGVFGEAAANQSTAAAANQSAGPRPTAAPAEGKSGSQSQGPSSGQRETREGPSGERRESNRGAEYLTNIGQMVAAILDPLDRETLTTQKKNFLLKKMNKKKLWRKNLTESEPKNLKTGRRNYSRNGKGLMDQMKMEKLKKYFKRPSHKHHCHKHPLNKDMRHCHRHPLNKDMRHCHRHPLNKDMRHCHRHPLNKDMRHCHRHPLNKDMRHCHRHPLNKDHAHFRQDITNPVAGCSRQGFGQRNTWLGRRSGKPIPLEIMIDDDSDVEIVFEDIGVDVTFDVRTKTSQGQTADAASTDPSPAPAQAPNAPAQAPNAPAQAPNAPAQSPNGPTQAPNVPAQAPNAPVQTLNTPAQMSYTPAQDPNGGIWTFHAPQPRKGDVPYWTPERMAAARPADFPDDQGNMAPFAGPTPLPATTQTDFPPAAGAVEVTAGSAPPPERRNSDDWTLLNRESPIRGEASAMEVDESQGTRPKITDGPAPRHPSDSPSAPPQDDLSDADRKRIQDALETFRAMGFNFDPDRLRDLLKKQNCDIFSVLEIMLNTERK